MEEFIMENKLARLFDYQKFEPNEELESIISDVESRYSLDSFELSDDDLELVSAAGDVTLGKKTDKK
jgi:hypothetical protein